MSGAIVDAAAPWIGVALTVMLAAVAAIALTARSLFVMAAALASIAALAAAAASAARGGEAAVALSVLAGVAPVVMLSGVLLSGRTAKVSRGLPWLVLVAACAGAGAFVFLAPQLEAVPSTAAPTGPIGFWLAGLVFVVAIGCAGLLGYGERGVLARPRTAFDS